MANVAHLLPWEVTAIDGGQLIAEQFTTANHGPCIEVVAHGTDGTEVSMSLDRRAAETFARRTLEHYRGIDREDRLRAS